MDDAGNWCASAVVDVGHCAGDGAGGGYAAEERRGEVGNALRHQLGVGVVVVADDAVGNGGREQRLNGSEHSDGECRCNEAFYCLPCHCGHVHVWNGVAHGEAVADGLDGGNAAVLLQHQRGNGHDDDGDERARDFLAELRCKCDDCYAHNAHDGAP